MGFVHPRLPLTPKSGYSVFVLSIYKQPYKTIMQSMMLLIPTVLLCLPLTANGFQVGPSSVRTVRPPTTFLGLSTAGYFQLEELEDKESATTEVCLKADNTVDVGETDGPLFVRASGTWKESQEGDFEMVLNRTYQGGSEQRESTAMGEFEFAVERVFTGQRSKVGEKFAVTGSMHSMDEVRGDEIVGYFNMIETTKERLRNEF